MYCRRCLSVVVNSDLRFENGYSVIHENLGDSFSLKVEVRKSALPSAGLGLFAKQRLSKAEVVCDYRGKVYTLSEALALTDKDYLMGFGFNVHICAKAELTCFGRYVNDPRDSSKVNCCVVKLKRLKVAFFRALRDIEIGEEIFIDYGQSYWKIRESKYS